MSDQQPEVGSVAGRTPADEQIEKTLRERFGSNWRQTLLVPVRADALYWIVQLAEQGLLARRQEWVKQAGGFDKLDMSQRMSLGSFAMDLEELAAAVRKAKVEKRK